MRDLSMHVLDIAQNSIRAGARLIVITIDRRADGWLLFSVRDDGSGIAPGLLPTVAEPFATTRTARRVGLGLSLLKQNAEKTGGSLTIESAVGQGTRVTARMNTHHIDCIPLGDVCASLLALIMLNPQKPDFLYQASSPMGQASFDTRTVRAALGGLPLCGRDIHRWMKESLEQALKPVLEV